jgi:hypothetical protein
MAAGNFKQRARFPSLLGSLGLEKVAHLPLNCA